MDNKILYELQRTELEILKVVDDFCKNHNIEYSLYAGTALGAVRHRGFIPWDDDVDIIMTRDEYEKFYDEWNKSGIEGYYFQVPDYDNGKTSNINHCKVRKDNTILLSQGEDINVDHNGVWIDIFILDKIKDNYLSKLYIYTWATIRNIFSRNRIGIQTNYLVKILFNICMKIPRRIKNYILKKSNIKIRRFNNLIDNYIWVDLATIKAFKICYPKNLTENFIDIKFEDCNMQIFKDYNLLLELEYGDYMKFPPVEEQVCKHNPVYIQL